MIEAGLWTPEMDEINVKMGNQAIIAEQPTTALNTLHNTGNATRLLYRAKATSSN